MPIQPRKYNFGNPCEEHCPYLLSKPRFGKNTQAPKPPDLGNHLLKPDIKHVQHIVGFLLFYGRVSEATIIKAFNSLFQQ